MLLSAQDKLCVFLSNQKRIKVIQYVYVWCVKGKEVGLCVMYIEWSRKHFTCIDLRYLKTAVFKSPKNSSAERICFKFHKILHKKVLNFVAFHFTYCCFLHKNKYFFKYITSYLLNEKTTLNMNNSFSTLQVKYNHTQQ